ncbi:RNA-binding protein 4.1-like [Triplophysa rosa]|uniref:RNA-binding protein 4.1 n=1 Tax=Triplophysa rosa TaxID=992332 RepID=A0A9W7X583_TRIRA|nr:RNA-binding protein 4.1-like [Triplophysa rosa]XP_057199954.1 RNA-binding protein 4.1-like [Triplophysa rosa]KAI7814238.1 RNA-binding protein 4.1 [Triplophysa rosa]
MVKIFVGNLSPNTTADDVRSLFSQYGKICECVIVKNFGFVHMDDKAEADEAIRNLHHYVLNGLAMNVELSKGKHKTSTKLHVGNISSSCTNQELRAKFEEYGPVVECDIVKEYAFVHMERVEDAMEAIGGLDNTGFQGKLMSVKLSTSRLRTAPGMGERTGCYRCGQEGHWSKECPMDQNGSYREGSGSEGYVPHRFGEGGDRGGRGFHRGFSGEQGYSGSFVPSHGFTRGAGYGVPGYGRGAGFESAMNYGLPAGYGIGADNSMAPAYGSEAAYGSSGMGYGGALPAYPIRRPPFEERDPYGVVDFYEKYRARPYGISYFEDRHAVPPPVPPPPSSSAIARPSSNLDPYERRPLPPPPTPASSYYVRDRSPIRRVPLEVEGYAYERTHISPSHPSSSVYDVPRDPYAEQARYAY